MKMQSAPSLHVYDLLEFLTGEISFLRTFEPQTAASCFDSPILLDHVLAQYGPCSIL